MTELLHGEFDEGESRRRHGMLAWLLSLIGHTALLILFSLLLAGRFAAEPETSIERGAGIVIAKSTTRQDTQYLDEQAFEETSSESQSDSNPTLQESLPQSEQVEVTELLPSSQPNVPLPLPGLDASRNLADQLSMGQISLAGDRDGEAEMMARERARLREQNRGPVGPPAEVSLFGSGGAPGHHFVFVIDRSKSMGGQGLGALNAARDELYRQLQLLKENHKFQIVAYHHKTVMLGRRALVEASEENVNRVPEYFAGLAAFGGTDHEVALHAAIGLEPDVIFLLTDGDLPELNQVQLQDIQRRCEGKTSIHCIQFGAGSAEESRFMVNLARMNRGAFHYVDMNRRRE